MFSAQIGPSQSWNASLKFFPGVVWELHAVLCGKLCLALKPAKISLTPGASCILPDGQGFFSFGFRLTQQRWHSPINSTWPTAELCPYAQPASNGCSPINVILSLFLRDLWGKDQSSLICETGTLLLLNDLFRGAGEHTATSSPRKAHFQAPEAPGVRLGAMDSHLTTHLLERRRADTLKMPCVILGPCWHPARVRLAGAAEADACPRLPAEALPSSDYPVEGKRYEWNPQSKSVVCSWNPSLS